MSFQVVSLLLVSLSFVLMEENGTRCYRNIDGNDLGNVLLVSVGFGCRENTKILQRRYSEGTLASDYSRTLDNMLKKNFVDWLLTRREHQMENSIDPSKREVESQTLNTSSHRSEAGFQDFLICLLQQSLTLLKGSNQGKDITKQEFLDWLISADLCRPMGH